MTPRSLSHWEAGDLLSEFGLQCHPTSAQPLWEPRCCCSGHETECWGYVARKLGLLLRNLLCNSLGISPSAFGNCKRRQLVRIRGVK